MSNINVGSQVVLRSGGPSMTIESFEESAGGVGIANRERVNCQWYDGVEQLRATFRVSSLRLATDEPVTNYATP